MLKPLLFIIPFFISSAYTIYRHEHHQILRLDTSEIDYFSFLDKKVKAVVEGPYVEIQYTYIYKNPKDRLVQAKFKFPQAENDILHKVEIKHENQDIARLVFEEINVPGKEYLMRTPDTRERFLDKSVSVGNVRPYEVVHIIFTVLKPLKIYSNQFYGLSLKAFYIARTPFRRAAEIFREAQRKWNVQIELRSEKPFAILANPTHQRQPKISNYTDRLSGIMNYKVFYNVTVHAIEYFTVYFAGPDFHAPQAIMATHPFNPHDHAFMFSVIPNMNYFPFCGWKSTFSHSPFHEEIQPILSNLSDHDNFAKLKRATVQSDLRHFPNEYLFVIDRSDSMEGPRLENLKKILNNFLGTLSKSASFFSILSFGNSSQLHWKRPEGNVPYKTPEDTAEIMKWVETIEADMGEKDLLSVLKYACEAYEWTPLPKNVIILTDGEVSNGDEIIQFVQANSHSQRICAMGVEGDEEDIIQKIGEAGGCPSEFPWGSEYFYDEALDMMDATLVSPGFNLAYEIKCLDEPGFAVYQEEGGYEGIPRDKAFTKWVTLSNIPNLKSCKAKIFYYSQHRCSSSSEEIEIFRSQKAEITDVWHKVAEHVKLRELEVEESKRKLLVNHMQEEGAPVVLNQILSESTPFVSQGVLQEELITHDKPPRSLYDIYQEQFNNLWCTDPKKPLLNSGFYPSDFPQRHEEHEEESFFSFNIICIASVFTLLFVAGLFII